MNLTLAGQISQEGHLKRLQVAVPRFPVRLQVLQRVILVVL